LWLWLRLWMILLVVDAFGCENSFHAFLILLILLLLVLLWRTSFLEHLVHTFDINVDKSTLVAVIVVNEQANQRALTKRGHDGLKVTPMARASRLNECGFRFIVGRAGIMRSDGRISFGTTHVQGLYLFEDSSEQDLEISSEY
jgi:hypothetical protein